jgi:hypothetical protein
VFLNMYGHYNKNQSGNFIRIVKEMHKLQCQSCGYSRVQDTKRDWCCEELEILANIHNKTFTDHIIAIAAIGNDQDLRNIISARRLQIAAKRRENLSAVAECMKELSKLDRNSLVDLWQEYSK